MTTNQRETIISQIMELTPTHLAINAIEILDNTSDEGLNNILSELSDSHGQSIWLGVLASI